MSNSSHQKIRVLVAGAAGASLGTEALKAFALSSRYEVVAADVSPFAYGLYQRGAACSYVLGQENYIKDVIECSKRENVRFILPCAEATLRLLSEAEQELAAEGLVPVLNRPEVIRVCSDKSATFECLERLGFPVPCTRVLRTEADIEGLPMPCVVKPATNTGGSAMVSAASTKAEALMYARWIWSAGLTAIAQEYLPHEEGEFTVGVLRHGDWSGAIAMRREFPSKLSYLVKSKKFLISTGYSQGLIDHFPDVCRQASEIASALGSVGPLNIQGRLVCGVLHPFEINPRFSATTYLRAMAGFPEIEMYLDHLCGAPPPPQPVIRPGYYLRSLAETYVPLEKIKRRP